MARNREFCIRVPLLKLANRSPSVFAKHLKFGSNTTELLQLNKFVSELRLISLSVVELRRLACYAEVAKIGVLCPDCPH